MSQRRLKSLLRKCGGAILAELSISIPILIMVGFGSLEVIKILRSRELMQSVAREAGGLAFRNCGWAAESFLEGQYGCLSEQPEIGSLNTLVPGAGIILSVYELQPGIPRTTRRLGFYSTNNYQSRYDVNWAATLPSLSPENKRILVAEVRLPFSAITPLIGSFFKNSEIYETVIF